jgi:hypothetical protein
MVLNPPALSNGSPPISKVNPPKGKKSNTPQSSFLKPI